MTNSQSQVIDLQIRKLICDHLQEIENYLGLQLLQDIETPDRVFYWLTQLASLTDTPPELASAETYRDARELLSEISGFLLVFNRESDIGFESTEFGRLIAQARQWLGIASKRFQLPVGEVWNRIAPAIPDHLVEVDQNTFEAQWWHPVPMMDVEILQRTEGISIVSPPAQPPNLPGGISVRFTIAPDLDHSALR